MQSLAHYEHARCLQMWLAIYKMSPVQGTGLCFDLLTFDPDNKVQEKGVLTFKCSILKYKACSSEPVMDA